ncbi:tRNA (adenosine(37)-N6)-threonylcarbamoyltransferase complex transferase subunit TsaD [Pseudomonadota bacterium]|nr:tRNA (adenosine(37)-N6)-threonylcarbamoyltransferase complex transferase subunit TsaD [Pseudomonadota bacterium]
MSNILVLGIETSCDETSGAIFDSTKGLLSNVVHSQIDTHAPYGGVVPELASRDHLSKIALVVQKTLTDAKKDLDSIDCIAYTAGPGLMGALMVGADFAKTLAWSRNIKCIPINHLEGHIVSPFLSQGEIEFPFLSLLVSGGHTQFILAKKFGCYEIIGESVDDAAGEAFDKVAKMIGLGYPGGPIIENLAKNGSRGCFTFPRPMLNKKSLDMSFSGLKTGVMRSIEGLSMNDQVRADISLEFLEAVSEVLVKKVGMALLSTKVKRFVVSGGVSANEFLRHNITKKCEQLGVSAFFPPLKYSTDNAAMIALAGLMRIKQGESPPERFNVRARWPVQLLNPP